MDIQNKKILVAGIGGVGGIISGQLIRAYGDNVSLIARGRRKDHLVNKGLTVQSDLYGEYRVFPSLVTESPESCEKKMPVQDVVLICTKNDALDQILDIIEPVVGLDTVVMSIMNGVRAGDIIKQNLKTGHPVESVIYTVSSCDENYVYHQLGGFTQIYEGSVRDLKGEIKDGSTLNLKSAGKGSVPIDVSDSNDSVENPDQKDAPADLIKEIFDGAGIECHVSKDIKVDCWVKYILNCAYNVVTARHGINIGAVKANPDLTREYKGLMEEARAVGLALGVKVPDGIVDKHMKRLYKTEDSSTSSLSRDFDQGKIGEMELFSGELIKMAESVNVDIPLTRDYYKGLKERSAAF